MAEGRQRGLWEHTSHLLCIQAGGKDPAEFNPYLRSSKKRIDARMNVRKLKGLFTKGQP